jgi:hypothetical protein
MKYLIIVFLLFSCSPQFRAKRKIRKAKRLAPELFVKDTVRIIDTVFVPSITYDTITRVIKHDSTIVINDEKVYLKYFYDTLRQEIHHDVECKEQKVIRENKVIVEKTIESKRNWLPWIIVGVLLLFLYATIKRK